MSIDDETCVSERIVIGDPSSMVPGWKPDTYPDAHDRAVGLEGVRRARAELEARMSEGAA